MQFKTSDGTIFDSESEAKKYQNKLDIENEIRNKKEQERISYDNGEMKYIESALKEGAWDSAIATLSSQINRARSMNETMRFYNMRGEAYLKKGDNDRAIQDFKYAANGGNTDAKNNLDKLSSPTTGKYAGYTRADFEKLIKTIKRSNSTSTQLTKLNAMRELDAGTFNPEEYEKYYSKGFLSGLFGKK
jgi:tetratricopeptide (TPR) repeat protein